MDGWLQFPIHFNNSWPIITMLTVGPPEKKTKTERNKRTNANRDPEKRNSHHQKARWNSNNNISDLLGDRKRGRFMYFMILSTQPIGSNQYLQSCLFKATSLSPSMRNRFSQMFLSNIKRQSPSLNKGLKSSRELCVFS